MSAAIVLEVAIDKFPLKQPFRISGHTMFDADVVTVTLEQDGHRGRGEASGVYYHADEDPPSMLAQLERVRSAIELGLDSESVQRLLPRGGARNALDCAWWDLESKRRGQPVWQLVGLPAPRPLLTTFTVSVDTPEKMAADALEYRGARAIKVKLLGDALDADRVRAVRRACPQVWLGVDANQGCDRGSLEMLLPTLVDMQVALIEQPCRAGEERMLDGLQSPIPLAADESAQGLEDLAQLQGRFAVVNIKLDKTGGLSEALSMARAARRLGLKVMVGNMVGSSLAMAPSFLVGQLCDVVDLDGPVFLQTDRRAAVIYRDGMIDCPPGVWGYP